MQEASVERTARELWHASASADSLDGPDGRGLLLRGLEFQPARRTQLDPLVLDSLLRLARLAAQVADRLRDHPDPEVRRAAALLAARGHPLLAAFDD